MENSKPAPRKVIPIAVMAGEPLQPSPASGDGEAMSIYQAQKKIYPRSVTGLFSKWRWAMVFITQLVFYGLPWLEWGQRQAVLFDLEARRFYILGLVLYPQDFIYLSGILVISALSLFLFTAVAGRQWCGYACPQTVYTEIFLWLEKITEGDRSARLRLDASPMSVNKFTRKASKQFLWIALSLWTGFTFVGYFTPIKELGMSFIAAGMGPWETFWVFFYGFATYGNAGYMREQVCKYMCPYARFQSAMFDKDTLIVTYDEARGEPRGSRSKKADPKVLNLGSCIDCTLCVQVCPTGIDIRKGLQYECISCAACIDVCDTVMDKMNYPRGLIRYSTQNAVAQGWGRAQLLRKIFRPRVLVYSAILLGVTVALFTSLLLRSPFKVDVDRDRASLARIVSGGKIENVYRLQVMNATENMQSYRITATGLPGLILASDGTFSVDATESRWVPVTLQLSYEAATPGSHEIHFEVEAINSPGRVTEKSIFLVPR
ncbi:4Fe-4S ferredoxin, iron-sulfur binding domain protein [Polaromonas naphthalenivorans CJ2]|uniref:4Fe-4S ferredoxin, iron-sulfur binding domain protein n=2 Tax=Polaromonas naphthalenivorans TaxID=216465 RepID=A1VTU6_POLNA|nr:4Fe-4S ferredoxin, iron-sulfur binding domain protein [Polaromonas naphthalenivorans CJ2]